MKKLLIFSLFMIMCSPAFALRVGKVDSDIENYMQVVYDSGELAAAVTDLTVSGLNGDDDETYEIFIRQVHGADDSNARVRLNGDYSASYGIQEMWADGSAASASRGTAQAYFKSFADSSKELSVSFCHHVMNVSEDLSKTVITTSTNGMDGTGVDTIYSAGQVWNNTDEVTSMTFTSDVADGFGIGSRFIILRKVPDNDTGMRVGDLEIQGRVKGMWELVAEENVDLTLSGGLTITGLSGDNDVLYRIESQMISSASNVFIRPNGDSGNNYGAQRLRGVDETVSAIRDDSVSYLYGCGVNKAAGAGDHGIGEMLLYAKSGYVRPCLAKMINGLYGTTVTNIALFGQDWANTEDNITSIHFAGIYGPGSYIRLWKLNLSEGDE